jgi:hypothetical protein
MAVNYTTNLSLGQPVTGTESGTWGDDVNNAVTSYLDIAISGSLALTSASFTANALTLTNTQGTSSATNIGATTAQYYALRVSSLAANVTITAPSVSKVYLVVNSDSTYSATVKASGQSGVAVAAGEKALVYFNGTDYIKVASTVITNLTGTLAATNGGTGQSSYAVGDLVYASTTTALSKLADVATGNALISGGVGVAPSYGKIGLTTHVSGTLPIANGGTNSTATPTNGGITYGTGTAQAYSAAGTSGQILTSAGAAAPTWSAVTGTGSVVKATSPTIATATLTGASTIQGLTVGLGAGAVSTNTAFGTSALAANSSGDLNVAVGYEALLSNGTGQNQVAVGYGALRLATSGRYSVAVGFATLVTATTAENNVAVGAFALNNATGGTNTAIGDTALSGVTSGQGNTALGYISGSQITTGSYNVVLGGYNGATAPISGTGSNWIVLSDGAGNVRQAIDSAGNATFGTGAVVVYAPAPASISTTATLTNANLQAQLINTTGTSYTVTMPTGSTLDTLVTWYKVDTGFDFSIINTASGTVTLAVNTGVTNLGALGVGSGNSARFRIRRTAASTYVIYRIT